MIAAVRAYIALGSNQGEPLNSIEAAIERLARMEGTRALRVSSCYRTPPWGDTDQPDFINAVAELDTTLDADALFAAMRQIECEAGRVRAPQGRRWGPRTLDLDLLAFGDLRRESEALCLPHPRLAERAFVLVPLLELSPELSLAPWGRLADCLGGLNQDGIEAVVPARRVAI